jgi:hypothetical protein
MGGGPWLLPVLGFAATVGGSALGGINKQQYYDAVNKAELDAYNAHIAAQNAELARQQAFQNTANADMARVTGQVSANTNATNRATAVDDFNKTYDALAKTSDVTPGLATGGMASDAVKTEVARRAATGAADARTRVKALAKFGSFDSAMSQAGQDLTANADALNLLGNARRGSLGVATQEMSSPAAQVAPGNNLLGPILSGAGSLLSGMGGQAGGFGGYTVDSATGQPTFNWLGIDTFLKGGGFK